MVVMGSDYLGPLIVPAGSLVGDVIFSNIINPTFLGPRLAYLARLYERYKFGAVTFRYVQATTTATAGSMIGYYDPDPVDASPLGPQGVKNASEHLGLSTSFWTNFNWIMPAKKHADPYWLEQKGTDSADIRLSQQSVFRLLLETPLPAAASADVTVGSIHVDFIIRLSDPQAVVDSPVPTIFSVPNVPDNLSLVTEQVTFDFGSDVLVPYASNPPGIVVLPFTGTAPGSYGSVFQLPQGQLYFLSIGLVLQDTGETSSAAAFAITTSSGLSSQLDHILALSGSLQYTTTALVGSFDTSPVVTAIFQATSTLSLGTSSGLVLFTPYPADAPRSLSMPASSLVSLHQRLEQALARLEARESKEEKAVVELSPMSAPDEFVLRTPLAGLATSSKAAVYTPPPLRTRR